MDDTHAHAGPSPTIIWVWLVTLVAVGLAFTFVPMGNLTIILLLMAVALAKATLVARYYMHLVSESLLIYLIAGIPLLLALGFALVLVPDVILTR